MRKYRWYILAFIFILIVGVYSTVSQNNKDKKYFNDLNLKLTGIVESVDLSYIPNGFGVVKVGIIESNIDFYDPRNDLDYYYCIVKNKKAEFYQHGLYNCAIGDTIEVDTRKRSFLIRNGQKIDREDISLLKYNKFYEYVQKKHQKF